MSTQPTASMTSLFGTQIIGASKFMLKAAICIAAGIGIGRAQVHYLPDKLFGVWESQGKAGSDLYATDMIIALGLGVVMLVGFWLNGNCNKVYGKLYSYDGSKLRQALAPETVYRKAAWRMVVWGSLLAFIFTVAGITVINTSLVG